MKKHKSHTSNEASTSDSKAKVFVLSPDLLAKLGISLNTVPQSEVVPSTTGIIKDNIQSVDHSIPNCLPENEEAPSIIQTANLMKESVFLSPTFFQTAPIVEPENEEPMSLDQPVDTNTTTSSERSTLIHQPNKRSVINSSDEQRASELSNDNIGSKPYSEVHVEEVINIENYESVKEYQVENDGDLILTDVLYRNSGNNNISSDKFKSTIIVDEHPDEAYLSDCSNSYSGCSPKSNNSEVNKQNVCKNKSKISPKAISADLLQFRNIGDMNVISSTTVTDFTPVDVNSTVTSCEDYSDKAVTDKIPFTSMNHSKITEPMHVQNSDSQNVPAENIVSLIPNQQNKLVVQIDRRDSVFEEILIENIESNTASIALVNSERPKENVEIPLSVNKEEPGFSLQENIETNLRGTQIKLNDDDKKPIQYTDNKSNYVMNTEIRPKDTDKNESVTRFSNSQDRVKEIATYLSEINKRKNSSRNKKNNIEKGAKCEPVTSKLCIQGVEKPGGKLIQKYELKCVSVSKTYKRAIIRKQIPKITEIPDAIKTSDSFQITDNNNKKCEAKVTALKHQNEFCICYDFGNLAYYDCEMLYEHIHFWSHKNIDYESEVLYSIYHEGTMFNQSVDFIEDTHHDAHDDNTTKEDKLCWSELNTAEHNEEKCELAINHRQPPHPSIIKQIIRDADFKNKIFLKSAKQTLNELGVVKCPVCITGFYTMSKFKRHVKNCTQQETNFGTVPKISMCNTPASILTEGTLKQLKKSVNVAVPMKKSLKLENVGSVTAETSPISKNCNNVESDKLESPTKKASKGNKVDKSKMKPTVIANLTVDKNNILSNETPTNTANLPRTINKSLESTRQSEENNDMTKLAKQQKNNHIQMSKTIDTKTYAKSARKVSDIKVALKSTKSTNDKRQEPNTDTKKSTKRLSNTAMDCSPAKIAKKTKSSVIIDTLDDVSMNQPVVKGAHSKRVKVEKQLRSDELGTASRSAVGSNKLGITDSVQNNTVEITIVNASFPNESMEMTTEESTTYDSIDNIMEESTVPDDSFAAAVENSTLSTDTTMNETQSTEYFMVLAPINESDDMTKCGVCKETLSKSQWIEHIAKSHDYIAWRDGEPPLDLKDEVNIKKHLNGIANENGGLACSKCGLVRKFAKAYLRHIESCEGSEEVLHQDQKKEYVPLNPKSRKSRDKPVVPPFTCGVCNDTVEQSAWIEHIQIAHKYLAWTTEEQPLNLDDAKEVKEHLKYISKYYGGLICSTCGVKWNYVKKYLTHISECETKPAVKEIPVNEHKKVELELPPIVTCGVCKLEVEGKDWIKHIQVAHQYMAWIEGEEPLDPNDPEQVKKHLKVIAGVVGSLVCGNCGEVRRHGHAFLQHAAACDRTGFQLTVDEPATHDKSEYTCGVCRETGKLSDWTDHAMNMHYNIAWRAGEAPINLRNPYAVEKYLKVYRKKHGLVCHHCKNSRSSCYGFYAHILTCGKTEEEIEAVHDVCELCNNKYLCIYRNQHMAAHRDSEQRRERRELQRRRAEQEAAGPPPAPELAGKRRAAEKAKKVIQKHSTNIVDGMPVCACGATFKDAEEVLQHSCNQKHNDDGNDSDVSVKIENVSEESADEIVDSGVSDEEEEKLLKKKRVRVGEGSTKVQRMPYRVNNYSNYLSQAYKDFVNLHYTTEVLFNEWRDSPYQVVPVEEMGKYLPQVTESCKVRFSANEEWTTIARFEAKKMKGFTMFIGGATQCIAWAPPAGEEARQHLAAAAHRGPDAPRLAAAARARHPAALQIWDCANLDVLPRCALCIAHEYGVVWGMDWCPSGAGDRAGPGPAPAPGPRRLGLLAVACSNGSAYIFAVPYPPQRPEHEGPVMYKLKPVAELRLAMTAARPVYQATSIKWSQQKDHSVIIVGYSDGTTALYDLTTESTMLKATEKGVTIFYPFQDRQVEGTSVTGVGVYATANESYPVGGQFSASTTGSTLRGASLRPSARLHLAAGGAQLAAHWPAVTLSGDAPLMRCVSEMEWWGGGRHAGAARAWAACARCARAACAAPPALRAQRHHPAYPDIKKLIVALLVMVPLGKKLKRKVKDDLSVVMEPLTYEDAAAKYGLQLTFVTKTSRKEQMQAQQVCNDNEMHPDRFPLSDIVALAFCPSARLHDKIAAATHTGLIFLINI